MKIISTGISKFIVSNVAVVAAIALLPVFLVTDNVGFFEHMMDYLFNNKS